MKHAVFRTSTKGHSFMGTCSQCGKMNLTLAEAMDEDCPNVRGLTQDESVIEAITGKPTP